MQIKGQHYIVVGLGHSGLATAHWLNRHGARVTIADSHPKPTLLSQLQQTLPQVETRLGPFRPATFHDADLLVLSPGVPPKVLMAAHAHDLPMTNDIDIFAQTLGHGQLKKDAKRGAAKVIAITGSNGKSTVAKMAGQICKAAGLKTVVAGNIGLPVLQALAQCDEANQAPDVWILELSSFQLEITACLEPDAAAVLNVSEDHLDRYPDMNAYAAAKTRILNGQGVIVLNREDGYCRGMMQPGRSVVWFGTDAPRNGNEFGIRKYRHTHALCVGDYPFMYSNQLPLLGKHNLANALAGVALCRTIGVPITGMADVLKHFKGLEHRIDPIAEIAGVHYYDDSKATNVAATVAALQGLNRRIVLIAGGVGKHQDFSPLRAACQKTCRAVVLIGCDAAQLAAALKGSRLVLQTAPSLQAAVAMASQLAQAGDAVLLSPACASFDMFRDYRHRASVFIEAVYALKSAAAGER